MAVTQHFVKGYLRGVRTAQESEQRHPTVSGSRCDILVPVRTANKVDDDINALLFRDPLRLLKKVLRLVVHPVRRTVGHLEQEVNLLLRGRRRRDRVSAGKADDQQGLTAGFELKLTRRRNVPAGEPQCPRQRRQHG